MRLVEALIVMFREVAALEAPCRLVVEGAAPVLDERVVEGTRTVPAVAGEAAEETAGPHDRTCRDPRRPKKNWTPRWRTTSTPTAGRQSLLLKPLPEPLPSLLRPTERLLRLLTLMTLI